VQGPWNDCTSLILSCHASYCRSEAAAGLICNTSCLHSTSFSHCLSNEYSNRHLTQNVLWLSPCRSIRTVMRLYFPRSKSIGKGWPLRTLASLPPSSRPPATFFLPNTSVTAVSAGPSPQNASVTRIQGPSGSSMLSSLPAVPALWTNKDWKSFQAQQSKTSMLIGGPQFVKTFNIYGLNASVQLPRFGSYWIPC
jgi:hypothetical protein